MQCSKKIKIKKEEERKIEEETVISLITGQRNGEHHACTLDIPARRCMPLSRYTPRYFPMRLFPVNARDSASCHFLLRRCCCRCRFLLRNLRSELGSPPLIVGAHCAGELRHHVKIVPTSCRNTRGVAKIVSREARHAPRK